MFAGSTNNDMIRIVMEYKGRLPNKMVKRHLISSGELMLEPHFEEDLKFRQHDVDKVSPAAAISIHSAQFFCRCSSSLL